MWKRIWKNERGFTLIELLAVIVILGIIAAIAVPSIGTIIDNSRKDAHLANARMMQDAARLYMANNPSHNVDNNIPLSRLVSEGYLEPLQVPGGGNGQTYHETNSFVDVNRDTNGIYTYNVRLVVGTTQVIGGSNNTAVSLNDIDRSDVILPEDEATTP